MRDMVLPLFMILELEGYWFKRAIITTFLYQYVNYARFSCGKWLIWTKLRRYATLVAITFYR
ncbi:hypothetical protein A3759_19280 [Thalassolituus sp. HI0120]|nr:hypothetical protein A3759_12450 [Thalassolituus sp. HI0120]KZZ45879.1 hypothetical protein A3759_19280 [Thalassolituus sp. HI0120]